MSSVACLFNLILFAKEGARCEYYRQVIKKVMDKYPCKVILITLGKTPFSIQQTLLQSATQVQGDLIEISYHDARDEVKIPFAVLSLLVGDLPTTLVWTEDPNKNCALSEKLEKMASRLIFDSENVQDIAAFAKKLLEFRARGDEIADLNWARFSGFRALFRSIFSSSDKFNHLNNAERIEIVYCTKHAPFYTNEKAQAELFKAYLASHLEKCPEIILTAKTAENLASGMILEVDIVSKLGGHFHCTRNDQLTQQISITFSTPTLCEMPLQFVISKTLVQNSLIKEITNKITSQDFLDSICKL